MAVLLASTPPLGSVRGQVPLQYRHAAQLSTPSRLLQDFRFSLSTSGEIRDRVMLKTSPTAPEVPMPRARIWVHRLVDGYKAWEGFSDALGYYHASGLELGVTYVVTGVDMTGEHKSTAGGPVVAQKG
ncbi:MAG: hypothetical protein RSD57_16250 [Comamonas sp.]